MATLLNTYIKERKAISGESMEMEKAQVSVPPPFMDSGRLGPSVRTFYFPSTYT